MTEWFVAFSFIHWWKGLNAIVWTDDQCIPSVLTRTTHWTQKLSCKSRNHTFVLHTPKIRQSVFACTSVHESFFAAHSYYAEANKRFNANVVRYTWIRPLTQFVSFRHLHWKFGGQRVCDWMWSHDGSFESSNMQIEFVDQLGRIVRFVDHEAPFQNGSLAVSNHTKSVSCIVLNLDLNVGICYQKKLIWKKFLRQKNILIKKKHVR